MADVDTLLRRLSQHPSPIPTVTRSSPSFPHHARSYNRVFSYSPLAICNPTDAPAVSHIVTAASSLGLKVQARGGGHSYAGYSAGGRDGSVVVDMRAFDGVELLDDGPGHGQVGGGVIVARVGAGVRLGRLARELWDKGKRAVPHGTIQNVGVGGHFSHGGYGYQSRAWGLAVDSIVALDVVLADGTRKHVTAEGDPELFYAFRGAADSFGIITHFHLKTVPAPETIVLFSFTIAGIVSHPEEATVAFLHIQRVVQDAIVVDGKISFGFYIHDDTWTIWGTFLGGQEHFEMHIAPKLLGGFSAGALSVVESLVRSTAWLDCLAWFSESHSNDATEEAFDTFYAQSVAVPEAAPLEEVVARKYFQTMAEARAEPGQGWYAVVNLHGGPSSAITSVPASSSAYTHRDSLWVIQHYGHTADHHPPLLDTTKAIVNRLSGVIREGYSEREAEEKPGLRLPLGAEPNYQDPDLSRDDAHCLYYGVDATRRLEAIKRDVDSDETFWNPQSIRPEPATSG